MIRYLLLREASVGSKAAVAVAVGIALFIWWQYPRWMVAATLLQLAASIYVLLYLKVNPNTS